MRPSVELVLHDATYVLQCRYAASTLVTPSSLEIVDGAYRHVGGESLCGESPGGEVLWPAVLPGWLARQRGEPYPEEEGDVFDELFCGRYWRWSDPRFPEWFELERPAVTEEDEEETDALLRRLQGEARRQ